MLIQVLGFEFFFFNFQCKFYSFLKTFFKQTVVLPIQKLQMFDLNYVQM